MDLAGLNAAPADEARAALLSCCASNGWADTMISLRPFGDGDDLTAAAERVWRGLTPDDWLEAFSAHPRIGEGIIGRNERWSRAEQATAMSAAREVLGTLAEWNRRYEERFGYRFLVFATGKTADEIIEECRIRIENEPESELRIAAAEQAKITDLRLRRLVGIG